MKGRGKDMSHKKCHDETVLPEVHFDFAFVGLENEPGKTMPTLVLRERQTRMTMSSVAPSKSTGTFIANRCVAFLKEIGCEHGDSGASMAI